MCELLLRTKAQRGAGREPVGCRRHSLHRPRSQQTLEQGPNWTLEEAFRLFLGNRLWSERPVPSNGSKGSIGSLNQSHISKPMPRRIAVATIIFISPRNDSSVFQDGCKGASCGLDLLDVLQLLLHVAAVASELGVAPGHHRPICQNCRKGPVRSLNLLHGSELLLHLAAVAAREGIPPSNLGHGN